ncbi:MAG: YraN family protein [Pseudomonadota bacterium]
MRYPKRRDHRSGDRGARAEQLAACFLAQRGLEVVERNVVYRGGELDLICLQGQLLVIVEVRHRRKTAFGSAAATVTAQKQRRIARAAELYIAERRAFSNRAVRFDVVEVTGALEGSPQLTWITDAFTLD